VIKSILKASNDKANFDLHVLLSNVLYVPLVLVRSIKMYKYPLAAWRSILSVAFVTKSEMATALDVVCGPNTKWAVSTVYLKHLSKNTSGIPSIKKFKLLAHLRLLKTTTLLHSCNCLVTAPYVSIPPALDVLDTVVASLNLRSQSGRNVSFKQGHSKSSLEESDEQSQSCLLTIS